MAGLDIAGAFDSAIYVNLVKSMLEIGEPENLVRFIGTWLTQRTFKIRLGASNGVVFSENFCPTRGRLIALVMDHTQ